MASVNVAATYQPTETRCLMQVLLEDYPTETHEFLSALDDTERGVLAYRWDLFGRPNQLPPVEMDWDTWCRMAGRGEGKTRSAVEWCNNEIHRLGRIYGPVRWALVGKTPADIRDVMVEGESGFLQQSPWYWKPKYEPSLRRLTWPDGSIATLYSSEEPDQLRGPQHHGAWLDEWTKFRYMMEVWDNLQFGLRLGAHPQVMMTFTPRPSKALRTVLEMQGTVLTVASTESNKGNLPPRFITTVYNRYAGTRLGRQELNAEILSDTPGALWTHDIIDAARVARHTEEVPLPAMVRMVVAADPGASHKDDDEDKRTEAAEGKLPETGIIVAGIDARGHGYVWDDLSDNMSPNAWGQTLVKAFDDRQADAIVGEINNGGDMVEFVVKTASVELGVPVYFKTVRASRGKYTRAEPVAALYEQGRVHHVGSFVELEDQMTEWVPGKKSPDRMDALVWALTELMLDGPGPLEFG
jgi:phage terminase large subunit-like protein